MCRKRVQSRGAQLAAFAGLALLFSAARASAQVTVAVGTCDPSVASYDEIQDAVDGVPIGGIVELCPGTWRQQVHITRSLTLTGVQSGNSGLPVIAPPAGGLVMNATGLNVGGFLGNARIAAQILVTGGANVNFSSLALDATNGVPNCLPDPNNAVKPVGIYFQNASGSVTQVAAKNHANACGPWPAQGGPQGDAVLIHNTTLSSPSVSVQNSTFRNFGWMAVEAAAFPPAAVANVTVDSNTLVGPGGTNGNGIAFFYAATGAITNNSISDALRTGDGTGFWGILEQCVTNLTISGNTVGNTDTAIALYNYKGSICPLGNAGMSSVTSNNSFNSRTAGMQICGSNNTVQSNTLNDNGPAGAWLINDPASCQSDSNAVNFNSINGACAAILIGNGNIGNATTPNNIVNALNLQVTGNSCSGGFTPDDQLPRKTLPGPPQP
jgi:hypothetical protein